jgi:hypothetical protein
MLPAATILSATRERGLPRLRQLRLAATALAGVIIPKLPRSISLWLHRIAVKAAVPQILPGSLIGNNIPEPFYISHQQATALAATFKCQRPNAFTYRL